jgi:hypothetical protein
MWGLKQNLISCNVALVVNPYRPMLNCFQHNEPMSDFIEMHSVLLEMEHAPSINFPWKRSSVYVDWTELSIQKFIYYLCNTTKQINNVKSIRSEECRLLGCGSV